jgi:hypothetical protein
LAQVVPPASPPEQVVLPISPPEPLCSVELARRGEPRTQVCLSSVPLLCPVAESVPASRQVVLAQVLLQASRVSAPVVPTARVSRLVLVARLACLPRQVEPVAAAALQACLPGRVHQDDRLAVPVDSVALELA